MKRVAHIIFGLFLIGAGIPTAISAGWAEDRKVAIVHLILPEGYDRKPFQETEDGFRQELLEQGYELAYQTFRLDFDGDGRDIIEGIKQFSPHLILTVGTDVTRFIQRHFADIPIVFAGVFDPVQDGIVPGINQPEKNLTGVTLKIKAVDQFRKMKELFPRVKRVGMLYDAYSENRDIASATKEDAEKAAAAVGLELRAEPVFSQTDITNKLNLILQNVDILWAEIDRAIYTRQASRPIVLATIKYKVPFMAFSSYVRAGALFGLEADYRSAGRQAAQLGIEILNGKSPGKIDVEPPKNFKLIVNKDIAEVLGVSLPAE